MKDPTSGLTATDLNAFVESPEGTHVRACADLATRLKHFRVTSRRRHLLELEEAGEIKQGVPIVFRAVKIHQHPLPEIPPGDPQPTRPLDRLPTGDTDTYEDAVEMLRRAIETLGPVPPLQVVERERNQPPEAAVKPTKPLSPRDIGGPRRLCCSGCRPPSLKSG